jgi:Na+/melibiose symporter-like transporter
VHDSKIISSRQRHRFGRVRDFLLYLAIAISIVALLIVGILHQAKTGGSANLPIKWLGFAGTTAVVFGYAIRACRRLWGRQKFWVLLGLFFAVHCGLGVFVLLRVPTVPLLLYGVLTGPEYLLLAAYLGFFLDSER